MNELREKLLKRMLDLERGYSHPRSFGNCSISLLSSSAEWLYPPIKGECE
jgi:hypothetical protein